MAGGLPAGDCRIPRSATDPARRYGENGSTSRTALSHVQDSPPAPATSTDARAQLVLPPDGAGGTRTPPEARQRLGLVAHRPNPPQAHARCDHEMWGRTSWNLHRLRHSMLTREAENGTNTPTLLARSRLTSVRSLERYARPGPEAVARHVAAPTPPHGAGRQPGNQHGWARAIAGSYQALRQAVTGGPARREKMPAAAPLEHHDEHVAHADAHCDLVTGGEPGGEREAARSPAVHDRAGPGRAGGRCGGRRG